MDVTAPTTSTTDDDGGTADRIESGQLVILIRHGERTVTLELRGELDLASAPALQEQLEIAAAAGDDQLVVDLRNLEFMDSTGLRVLVHGQRQLTEDGREMVLHRGSPAIQRLFELSQMDRLFRFEP